MMFDTDVLIWLERGYLKAARLVDSSEDPSISVVTYMELIEGACDKAQLRATREMAVQYGFAVLPLTEETGHRAAMYLEMYRLKTGLDLVDALVAATAVENGVALCTANVKHFRTIAGLAIKAFRP